MADNPGIKPNRFRWSCHPDMEIRVLNLMKREFHEEVSGKRLSSKLWTSLEKRINDDQIQARSIMMWFRALKNQYLAFKEDPSLQPPKHFELLDSIFGKADFIRKKPATGKGSDVKINFKEFDQTAENDDGINLNIFRFRPVLKKPALKPTAMNLQPIPMEEIEDNLERNALHSFCQSNQQNQVLAPDELPLDEMIKKSRIKSLEPIPVALDTHEEEPEDIADIMKKVKADTKTSSSTSIFTKQPVLITPRRVLINPSNIGQFYAQAKNHPTPVLKIDGKKADKPQRLILDFEPVIPAPATPLVEQEIIEPVKKQSRKQKIECFVCKIKITRESQNQHYAICLENSLLPNPNHANTVNLEKVLDQFKSCIYCKTDISPKLASLKLGHLKNCASLDELGLSTLIEEIKLLHCSLSEQTQFVKPTIKNAFDFLRPPPAIKKSKKLPKNTVSKIALGPETLDIFKTKTEDYLNKAVALPVAVEPIRLNLDMDAGSGSSSGSGNSLWDMGRGKRDLIKRVPQVSQFQPSSQEAHNISSPVKNSSPTKRSFENIDSDGLGHCSGIVKRIGIEGVSEIGVLSDIDAMTDEYLSEADDVVIEKPTIRESPSKVAVKYSKIDLDNVRIEYQAEIQAKKDATIASINQLKEHINVDNREKTILEIQSCKEEYRSFALIKSGECASRLEELASNGIIEHPVIELESEYGQQTRMESSLQIRPGSLSLPSTQSQKLELSQPFEPVAEPFAKAKSNPLLMRNSVLKIKNLPQVDFVPTKRTLGFSAIFEVEYLPSSRNFNTQTDIVHTSDIGLSPIQNDVEIRLEIAPSPVKAPVQLSKIDVCDEESDEPTQEFFNSVDISKSVVLVNSPDPEISNLHHLLTSGGDSFPVNSYSPSLALEEALGVSLETVEPNTTSQQKQQLFTDDDLFSALDEQEMMNLEIPAVSQKQVGVTFAPNSPDLSANEQFQLKQSQSQDLLLDLLRVEKSYSNNVEYESFSVTKNSNVDDIIEVEETQSPDLVVMVNSNRAPLDETKFDLNEEHLVNYSEDEDILSLNEEPPQTQVESTQHPNSKQNDSVLAKLQAPMPDYKRMTLAELKILGDEHNLIPISKSFLVKKLTEIWSSVNIDSSAQTGAAELKDPFQLIMEAIQANVELYTRILRYEPLDLEETHEILSDTCSKKQLAQFLDQKGINYLTDSWSQSRNRKKK